MSPIVLKRKLPALWSAAIIRTFEVHLPMNYRPCCQHCKSHGSQGTPFLMVTLDADWMARARSQAYLTHCFRLQSLRRDVPAVTYRHEAQAGIVCNVLERDVV
jgi:hypothetical protein